MVAGRQAPSMSKRRQSLLVFLVERDMHETRDGATFEQPERVIQEMLAYLLRQRPDGQDASGTEKPILGLSTDPGAR